MFISRSGNQKGKVYYGRIAIIKRFVVGTIGFLLDVIVLSLLLVNMSITLFIAVMIFLFGEIRGKL